MDKVTLLNTAIETVADRGEDYGTVQRNFQQIADRWTVHVVQNHGIEIVFTPRDVAMMNIDMKLARLAHSPDHVDSIIDIAGYAACLADLLPTKEKDDDATSG
jgi:hypothetical protein